ncbi:hypothetical protein AAIH46_08345 [Rhizobium sp. 0TCS1.26]|uniref:hypothetical protein n=1 Tax=Rhizobium sp. 0TCS1.26 TaxID=3142623 RepID=UPI003D284143
MRTTDSNLAILTNDKERRDAIRTGRAGLRWIVTFFRPLIGTARRLNRLGDLDQRQRRDLGLQGDLDYKDPIDRAARQDALLQQARDRALLLALGHRAR